MGSGTTWHSLALGGTTWHSDSAWLQGENCRSDSSPVMILAALRRAVLARLAWPVVAQLLERCPLPPVSRGSFDLSS